jgi:GT2 family glycosyltransferase
LGRCGFLKMLKNTRVSVSIINWNGRDVLIDCLSALKDSDFHFQEIVVFDNGSIDGSVDMVRNSFPDITVIAKDKNYGVVIARNMSLQYLLPSGVDYILFLDNDIIIQPSSIKKMIDTAESDPEIGLVAAKLYYFDRPDIIYSAGGYINYTQNVHGNRGMNKKDIGQYEKVEPVDSLGFACMLIRSSIIYRVGLLDTNYIGYGFGDTDFCMRVRLSGYKIMFCPYAKVFHKHKFSSSNARYTFKKKYLEAKNAIRFVRKYGNPKDKMKYAFYTGFGIPYAAIREGFRGNLSGVIGKVYGLFDGLRGRNELALKLFESQSKPGDK